LESTLRLRAAVRELGNRLCHGLPFQKYSILPDMILSFLSNIFNDQMTSHFTIAILHFPSQAIWNRAIADSPSLLLAWRLTTRVVGRFLARKVVWNEHWMKLDRAILDDTTEVAARSWPYRPS